MMQVFVTGGTGFIGSHVVMELVARGNQVTILARDPLKIPAFQENPQIRFVHGSMGAMDVMRKGLAGADACIHIGLNYDESRGWKSLLDDTAPTMEMAVAAAELGVQQFLYTSSTSVHDNLYSIENWPDPNANLTIDPKVAPTPCTYYGATKAACEAYLSALSYQSSMHVNVIRPGYTFGNPAVAGAPIQADDRFRRLIRLALANQPIELAANDGTQFIWAGHIAKVYADLMESPHNRKTYYALSPRFTTWAELAQEAISMTGSRSELRISEAQNQGALTWDVRAIERDFGHSFDPWSKLIEHLDYCIRLEGSTGQ